MLRGLDIRDMLIIDRLELAFQSGLNVLTGETGAGKSILLDALGFVLGWRGRAELVRQGAEQGEVTAWFDLPAGHPGLAVLQEAGISIDDELILRRVNARDGRKTAWINDRRVSGEVLRALSDTLVELHGQHDDRGLLNPRGHRHMLDSYAGLDRDIDKTRDLWRTLGQTRKALDAAERRIADAKAEEDYLRHAVAELDGLAVFASRNKHHFCRYRQLLAPFKHVFPENLHSHRHARITYTNHFPNQLYNAAFWYRHFEIDSVYRDCDNFLPGKTGCHQKPDFIHPVQSGATIERMDMIGIVRKNQFGYMSARLLDSFLKIVHKTSFTY